MNDNSGIGSPLGFSLISPSSFCWWATTSRRPGHIDPPLHTLSAERYFIHGNGKSEYFRVFFALGQRYTCSPTGTSNSCCSVIIQFRRILNLRISGMCNSTIENPDVVHRLNVSTYIKHRISRSQADREIWDDWITEHLYKARRDDLCVELSCGYVTVPLPLLLTG
jgi:hypothetical protein